MSNPGMRLTKDGMNLLAKGLTGKLIEFTKGQLGDGDFDYNSETVLTMTCLKSPKLDMPIVGKEIHGDGCALIKTQVINAKLTTGFRAKEHGIFAKDPDTGLEILYAYRNAGDEYSFIPAGNGVCQINATKAYLIEIQDATNISFNIDWDFAYVSQAEYNLLNEKFKLVWSEFLVPDRNIVNMVLNHSYIHSGETTSDNGVPTTAEAIAILKGNYTHTDISTDTYTLPTFSSDVAKAILNRAY